VIGRPVRMSESCMTASINRNHDLTYGMLTVFQPQVFCVKSQVLDTGDESIEILDSMSIIRINNVDFP